MEQDPFNQELAALVEQTTIRDVWIEKAEVAFQEYYVSLSSQGIDFIGEEGKKNTSRLDIFTKQWIMFELSSVSKGNDAIPDAKKRVQASLLLQGYEQPWVDLAGQIYPGEPITDENDPVFVTTLVEHEKAREVTEELMGTYDKMKDFLTDNGVIVDHSDFEVLNELSPFIAMAYYMSEPTPENEVKRAEIRELARTIITKHQNDYVVWMNLINTFF